MRILHICDFPNPRAERLIQLNTQMGHVCACLASVNQPDPDPSMPNTWKNLRLFRQFKTSRAFRLGFIPKDYFLPLQEVIETFSPDLIDVHEIYFLNFIYQGFKHIKELRDTPILYSDHEMWSTSMKHRAKGQFQVKKVSSGLKYYLKAWRYGRWEKRARKCVTLTISDGISRIYQKKHKKRWVFFIANMPTKNEVEHAKITNNRTDEKTALHVGNDFTQFVPYRNTRDLLNLWRIEKPAKLIVVGDTRLESDDIVDSRGFLSHMDLYQCGSHAHYGLLPYLYHPFHSCISPNKIYMYMHSGALPILPYYVPFLWGVPRFSSEKELIKIIKTLPLPNETSIRNYAMEHFLLDNYIEYLKHIYEVCQEQSL